MGQGLIVRGLLFCSAAFLGCQWFVEILLETKKCKWPSLDRFINLRFSNDELKDLHLCLHAPKLDIKGASIQLLGASSLTNLTSELVEVDFVARGRLADTLSNWVTTQALLKDLEETYEKRFGDGASTEFVSHIEVLRVLVAFLFSEVKTRTEDFFRARKARRNKVFVSCAANLRADHLLKSSPFSVLLFQQSVVDTILAELRTADKDPGLAFGKSLFPKDKQDLRRRKGSGKRKEVRQRNPFVRTRAKEVMPTKGTVVAEVAGIDVKVK